MRRRLKNYLRGKLAAALRIPIDSSPSPRSAAFWRSTVCASSVTRWRLTWAPSADLRPALLPDPPLVDFGFIGYAPILALRSACAFKTRRLARL